MEEERAERKEESPREHGKVQCRGMESPVPLRGGALTTAWAPCSRASVRLAPCLRPAHRSRLERIPLTAVSSSRSFKNRLKKKCLSVFPSTLQARKSHPARPPPTQTPPPPLRCRQRGLYNLKKSPCVAQGGLSRPGRRRSFQEKKLETCWHTSAPCLPREQPGKKLGLSTSAAAPSTVRRSTTGGGSRAALLPVTAQASPVLPQQRQAGTHPGQAMLPIPRAGAEQDGPNRPHAESPGSPDPGQARLAGTAPHADPAANQGSTSHEMPPRQ